MGTGEGGEFVICDDPLNAQEATSDADRENVLEWWDQTMANRFNDYKKGSRIVIMQRLHQMDLTGHLIEQGGYEKLILPAEFEEKKRCVTSIWRDPRKIEGELLWPERMGPPEIAEQKNRLQDGYRAQYQQRLTTSGGSIF